jgi:hypothetical protein
MLRSLPLALLAACAPTQTPDATDAGTHTTDGSSPSGVIAVPLTTDQGFAYMAPITIGGQTFHDQVDTGSTSTAVASTTCTTCKAAGVTPTYTAGSSATDENQQASTEYADMSGWSGEVFADTASVGGSPSITLDFASITTQTQFFTDNTYQGILGLGPDDLLEPGTTSFVSKSIAAGMPAVMAFQMCPDRGTMWLGGFDPAAASAAPAYTPMLAIGSNQPFYAVKIAAVTLGGTSLGSTQSAFGVTLVDTGTSISYVPKAVVTKLVTALNGSAGFQALFGTQKIADGGCVTAAAVTPDQVDAMLPAMAIQFPVGPGAPATPALTLAPTRSYLAPQAGGQYCLVVSDSGDNTSLIGDTLMASFVTVFDVGAKQIGFAPQVGCAEATAASAPHVAQVPTGVPWWTNVPHFRGPPHRAPR